MKSVDPAITQRAAEKLRSFDRPVLIAWAADDKAFPVELAHRLGAVAPDGRVELIADSYAFTPVDQPEKLASLIASFVREPAPAAS
jgi:pimeloyl-ACP methyl ester carboxylesterase